MEHRAPTTLLPVGANEQTACTHPLLFINNCYLVSIILSLKIAYLRVVPTLGGYHSDQSTSYLPTQVASTLTWLMFLVHNPVSPSTTPRHPNLSRDWWSALNTINKAHRCVYFLTTRLTPKTTRIKQTNKTKNHDNLFTKQNKYCSCHILTTCPQCR